MEITTLPCARKRGKREEEAFAESACTRKEVQQALSWSRTVCCMPARCVYANAVLLIIVARCTVLAAGVSCLPTTCAAALTAPRVAPHVYAVRDPANTRLFSEWSPPVCFLVCTTWSRHRSCTLLCTLQVQLRALVSGLSLYYVHVLLHTRVGGT